MPNDKQSRAELVERLRQRLGGVSVDLFGGDNLAIFLASEFEPGIEDDATDLSGTWKQGAIDAANSVLDAIHAHYLPAIESQASRIEELEAENKRLRDRSSEMHRRQQEAQAATQSVEAHLESWIEYLGLNHKRRDARLLVQFILREMQKITRRYSARAALGGKP